MTGEPETMILTYKYRLKDKSAKKALQIVNESWTSRTCSDCGTIPDSSPKGRSALGIREWTCSGCGSVHDRDVNAARNILGRSVAPRVDESRGVH